MRARHHHGFIMPKKKEIKKPRPGWAPDPLMVGIRSPIGLVVESCTSHPGVLGSIPKREEPGKTGAPCVKVPGSSRVPAPPGVKRRRSLGELRWRLLQVGKELKA